MSDKKNKNGIVYAIIIWLAIWQVAAMLMNQRILLASPLETLKSLVSIVAEEDFFATIAFSTSRILGGFLLGVILGSVLAVFSGKHAQIETFLKPLMFTIKTVPVASFVVMALVWLSSSRFSGFISFLIVIPVVYNNILSGIKSLDHKMLEMAEVFRMSFINRLLYIWLPSIKSHVFACFSIALGMCWKAGIAAEVIGIPDGSIGEKLYSAKAYLDTADLLAWTVVIVILSVAGEKFFMFLLKEFYRRLESR